MAWQGKADPMEEATEKWLLMNRIKYRRMDAEIGLDFYLPDFDLYIEVKRFHSPRIGEQMSRAENVIVIQGIKSFDFIMDLLYWKQARSLMAEPSAHNALRPGSSPGGPTNHCDKL